MNKPRLHRSTTDKMLAGICAGLGDFFGLDATIVRLLFIILFITGTFGFWAYLILWIIMPVEPENGLIDVQAIESPAEVESGESEETVE
jgi:phage shock protein C